MYPNINHSDGLAIAKIFQKMPSGNLRFKKFLKISKINDLQERKKEYDANKENLQIVPIYHHQNEDDPNRYYLTGTGGSGKSHMARLIGLDYLKQYPRHKIVLISGIPREDEKIFYCGNREKIYSKKTGCGKIIADIKKLHEKDRELTEKELDKIEKMEEKIKNCKSCGFFKKLKIDESILDDPIDISIFKDCLVIFDDIDRLNDDEIIKELEKIKKKIFNSGRTSGISVMTIDQLALSGYKTQNEKNNSLNIIVFPQLSPKHQVASYLKKYLLYDNNTISKILQLPSRWVMLNSCVPNYILWDQGCELL